VLSLPPAVRIFVATAPTNMHLSFDRLAALARDVIHQDPLSGHLFAFFNRPADRVKILYWDRSGFCLWYKRLEWGAAQWLSYALSLALHGDQKCACCWQRQRRPGLCGCGAAVPRRPASSTHEGVAKFSEAFAAQRPQRPAAMRLLCRAILRLSSGRNAV
jgi:hypothetical protein